jgi:hypothetical protein
MSTTDPSQSGAPAQIPGWASVPEDELDRLEDETTATTIPPRPDPSSSSPSSSPPLEDQPAGEAPASSIPGSPPTDDGEDHPEPGAELSSYLEGELEELGASILDVAGRALNRIYRRRTQTSSRLWLATQDETEAFGAAAARIAARHLPDELAEDGDPADGLVLGSVALGYVLRNTAGLEAPGPELEAPGPSERSTFPFAQPAPPPAADTSGAQPADEAPPPVKLPVSTVISPDL